MMTKQDKLRMVGWLLLATAFYALATMVAQPQIQTALWKCGHITIGFFGGYWADRNLYGRLEPDAPQGRVVARALVVGAAVLGMAFGL